MGGLLLTGFEPFTGHPVNPSELLVRELEGESWHGLPISIAVLPVTFRGASRKLILAIESAAPQAVLCLGVHAGARALRLERQAFNESDARIADNLGEQPKGEPIALDGPPTYSSTLPLDAMARAIAQVGVPAEFSESAGRFVCNHVFYCLMHALRMQAQVVGGFLHVPLAAEYVSSESSPASLPLETMRRGVFAAATAIRTTS